MAMTPPDNVYRPPYELISCAAIGASSLILTLLPIPSMALVTVETIFITLFIKRYLDARRIRKFRKSVKRLPFYALTADEVPMSDKALFMGKGFEWNQTHTQRLNQIRTEYMHLKKQSYLYELARQYEISVPGKNWLTKLTSSTSWWNPVAPLPPVGGSPEIHGVEINEKTIWSDIGERVGHMLVLGTTRVGKTRFAEILVTQDIRRGDVTIMFDPKGDADLLIKMYVESKKSNRPFYMFHLGFPEHSCRYNPIADYGRITEVATRIANQLPGDGQSAAFKEFVWRFVNVLARTMEALSIKPSYKNIYECASNVDELAGKYFQSILNKNVPNWKTVFETFELDKSEIKNVEKTGRNMDVMRLGSFAKQKELKDDLIDPLYGVLSNDRSYFEKLVSSLYPLLEKLTTGKTSELISPNAEDMNDKRPIIDWQQIMGSNAVVYVGLDSLSDHEVAAAVGNAMFADLTSLAGKVYKHGHGVGQSMPTKKRMVALHADEFNELIGDEFIPMLNKAGGAGYQVTAYTQTWADIEAKIGSKSKALQMGGNFNSLVMLRVKTEDTARMLTDQLPEVRILSSTLVSGASDVAFPDNYEDFGSRNEDRMSMETTPMLSPVDLTSLPKGQAFALLNGGQLSKIRLPLPKKDKNEKIPSHIDEIATAMRKKSGLSKSEDVFENAFVEGENYGG